MNNFRKGINHWMSRKKKLKLDDKRTESITIGTKHDIAKYSELQFVHINSEETEIYASVEDLEFITDKNRTCNNQIQKVIKT